MPEAGRTTWTGGESEVAISLLNWNKIHGTAPVPLKTWMHIIKVVAATIMGQDWWGGSRHDPWGKGRGRIWLAQMQFLVYLFMKHWSSLGHFTIIPSQEWCFTLAWSCEHMIILLVFCIFVFQCSISVQTVAACSLPGDASCIDRTVQKLARWELDGWDLQAPLEY